MSVQSISQEDIELAKLVVRSALADGETPSDAMIALAAASPVEDGPEAKPVSESLQAVGAHLAEEVPEDSFTTAVLMYDPSTRWYIHELDIIPRAPRPSDLEQDEDRSETVVVRDGEDDVVPTRRTSA